MDNENSGCDGNIYALLTEVIRFKLQKRGERKSRNEREVKGKTSLLDVGVTQKVNDEYLLAKSELSALKQIGNKMTSSKTWSETVVQGLSAMLEDIAPGIELHRRLAFSDTSHLIGDLHNGNLRGLVELLSRVLETHTTKVNIVVRSHCKSDKRNIEKTEISCKDANMTARYKGNQIFNNTLDLTDDIQRRIRLASAVFGRLSTRVLLNKNINIRTRAAVYNAVCDLVLLYGCESWMPYRRHIKMLERFHISRLQQLLGLHWWNRIPYAEIRGRINSQSLEVTIANRQLRWAGHVIRMP
ncbi:Hypothetical predicted protein [Octopus vulgaris]|uniref:Uncharacterized protein n=1 Tax=Octopus vulgaris TaxID=6645 RepID=A0AA36FFF1_OCTVU|nr:Hypothetical predicted protein [Octopus vulgaris]